MPQLGRRRTRLWKASGRSRKCRSTVAPSVRVCRRSDREREHRFHPRRLLCESSIRSDPPRECGASLKTATAWQAVATGLRWHTWSGSSSQGPRPLLGRRHHELGHLYYYRNTSSIAVRPRSAASGSSESHLIAWSLGRLFIDQSSYAVLE